MKKNPRTSLLKIDKNIKKELDKLIKKINNKRKKKFDHSEILEGIIGMIKFYKLENELQCILFNEKAS